MPIPDGSTPIKHEVLTDIFAKGLLSYPEMRIVCQIIRLSWGYDDPKNGRRQDWTNPLTIAQLSKDINMKYPLTHRTIKGMVKKNILLQDKDKYQFNEHYEQYITGSDITKSDISLGVIQNITASDTNITGSDSPDPKQTQIDIDVKGEKPLHKEISKDNKDNLTSPSLTEKSLKEKDKVSGAKMQELIKSFCQEMGFQYGSASIKINVKSAKWLLENYEMNQILDAVKWQKSKIIKEKKNPAIFIPNLVTVQKWVDNWIGNMSKEKEELDKQKKGGYII